MKMKTCLMFAFLAFSSQSIAQQSSPNMVHPYVALTGCSVIPPNGYVVSGQFPGNFNNNCGTQTPSGYFSYFAYESYFDKPVGSELVMCQGNYPVPDGWYQVGTRATTTCYAGQTQALVIQRYQ